MRESAYSIVGLKILQDQGRGLRVAGIFLLLVIVLGTLLAMLMNAPATVAAQEANAAGSPETSEAIYSQLVITGPAGTSSFGSNVVVLANGNYVVADPSWDSESTSSVGAAYLYDGRTHTQIARLTGSSQYDSVGSRIIPLANGDYVVVSYRWSNGGIEGAGAVTLCNGETGCNGEVTSANSLVGSTEDDWIGWSGIQELPNGDFLVMSQDWTNGASVDAGAITHCSGTTGCVGTVSATNSVVGSSSNDNVGNRGVTILPGGDYVVNAPEWTNTGTGKARAGAVRLCPAAGGCAGVFTPLNSLVGTNQGDSIGYNGIVALDEGGYVIASSMWQTGTGAATWCGTGGCIGTITVANSLIGAAPGAYIGYSSVTALAGGGYTIASPMWDDGTPDDDRGLVVYCPAGNPCTGVAIPAMGLSGGTQDDMVGEGRVTPLPNGGYVVSSSYWSNGAASRAGAVTFCPPVTGCRNMVVSPANSLVGDVTQDLVGNHGITVLESGAYVVGSNYWDRVSAADAGAVTRCNPNTGCVGNVNQANSLVGASSGDGLGYVEALVGGGYVVGSYNYSANGGTIDEAGIAVRCGGATGCTGVITETTALVGSSIKDNVGTEILPLANGNYVVNIYNWSRSGIAQAGAVRWCARDLPCLGPLDATNALVGTVPEDSVADRVDVLPNGNYVATMYRWNLGALEDTGAVMLGDGRVGTVGEITPERAVVGTVEEQGYNIEHVWNDRWQFLIVTLRDENRIVIYAMQFPLTVALEGSGGGTVQSDEAQLACTAQLCEVAVNGTTVVTLTATPDGNSTFAGWGGECAATAPEDACVVTMDRARAVVATFTSVPPVPQTLTVAKAGTGSGTVTGAGINCGGDCSETFAAGTVVTLTAEAAVDSVFVGWSGDCTGSGACSVTMNAARSVTAEFAIKQLEVTLPSSVDGGTIVVEVADGQTSAAAIAAQYAWGTVLRFTATPNQGYRFVQWTGDLAGAANPVEVALTESINAGAIFEPLTGTPGTPTPLPEQGTPTPVPDPSDPDGEQKSYLPMINR